MLQANKKRAHYVVYAYLVALLFIGGLLLFILLRPQIKFLTALSSPHAQALSYYQQNFPSSLTLPGVKSGVDNVQLQANKKKGVLGMGASIESFQDPEKHLTLPIRYSSPMRVESDGYWVEFTPDFTGQINQTNAEVSGSTLIYPSVLPDVDIIQHAMPYGVKEDIIIKGKNAPTTYTWKMAIDPRLTPQQEGNTISFYTSAGAGSGAQSSSSINKTVATSFAKTKKFEISPPFLMDARGGKYFNVAASFTTKTYTLAIKKTWLDAQTSFPLLLDPTVLHNSSSVFATGEFNRSIDAGSGSNPSLTTNYHELAADANTVGLWHMNEASGNVLDSSGNGNTGTPTGTSVVDGILGKGRQFGTTGDTLWIPDSTSLRVGNTVTIGAWVYMTSIPATYQQIVGKYTTDGYRSYMLEVIPTTGTVRFYLQQTTTYPLWTTTTSIPLNTWTHVVGVFNKSAYDSSDGAIYFNGIKQATSFVANGYSSAFNVVYSAGKFSIGSTQDVTNIYPFKGIIDEVAIWNRVLTPEEIKQDAQRFPYSIYTSPVIDLTGAGIAPLSWTDLTWLAQGIRTGDGETLASSEGLVAQWNFNETSLGTAYNGEIPGITPTPSPTPMSTPTPTPFPCSSTGLAARWNMNESSGTTTVSDSSGNSNTGTSASSTNVTDGYRGNSRSFNGTSDYIDFGAPSSLNINSPFTTSMWVRIPEAFPNGWNGSWYLGNDPTNSGTKNYVMWGNMDQYPPTGNPFVCNGSGFPNLSPNTWYWVTFVSSGLNNYIYVNGDLKCTGLHDIYSGTTPTKWLIGTRLWPSNAAYFYKGDMDEVYIYNRALLQSEITSCYNEWLIPTPTSSPTPTPLPGGTCGAACNGTLTNFTNLTSQDALAGSGWTAANKRWGAGALMFDGTDDFVTIPDSNLWAFGTNNFAIEFWMNGNPSSQDYATVIGQGTGGTNSDISWTFQKNGAGGVNLLFVYWNGTTTPSLNSNTPLFTNTWHHVVVTRNGNTLYYYVDGILTNSSDVTGISITNSTTVLSLGQRGSYGSNCSYKGLIDSTRIYSRALSAGEILSNYNAGSVEFQTRTSADGLTWEAWKPAASATETQIDSMDTADTTWKVDNGLSESSLTKKPVTAVSVGTGTDGACSVTGITNINTQSCAGKATADGVSFSSTVLTSAGATSIVLSTTPTGLAVGDEFLIINQQGTTSNNKSVGLYETHVISGINGNTLSFTDYPLKNTYDGTTQKITVQRIPNYTNVTVGRAASGKSGADANNAGYSCLDLKNSGANTDGEALYSATGLVGQWNFNETKGFTLNSTSGTQSSISLGGGTVTDVDGYRIHTFTADANLIVPSGGERVIEVLVVGGGGGGGSGLGGGAGAGGLVYTASYAVTNQSYTVTVGGGGAGGAGAASGAGVKGGNSVFGTVTAIGGGGGSGQTAGLPTTGGSGGGSSAQLAGAGAAGTTGQGNAGGDGLNASGNYGGGGGGGAGAVGGNGTSTKQGDGGVGLEYSQFASVGGSPAGWFAGGGTGSSYMGGTTGTGGAGGGANGRITTGGNLAGYAGTANTGGGGGAAFYSTGFLGGGTGGSGIVIVRYPYTPLANEGVLNNFASIASQDQTTTTGWTAANKRWGAGALMFDGTDDYVSVAANSSLNLGTSTTISVWFNRKAATANQTLAASKNYYTVGSNGNWLFRVTSATALAFASYDGQGNAEYKEFTVPAIADGTWNHAVVSIGGGVARVYLNGVESSSGALTHTKALVDAGTNGMYIGKGTSNNLFNGYMDSVSIYSRVLTAEEINSNAIDSRYWIDPDGAGGNAPVQAQCNMTRDGGGWTMAVKPWYLSGAAGKAGALGAITDATTKKGNAYKLADATVRDIIGPSQNFDVMADQAGFNSLYSTGNYEYVVLRNYTGYWRFDIAIAESLSETLFQSYRLSDNALASTYNLQCGWRGIAGINCDTVLSNNPQGGAGCNISMGSSTAATWHRFGMGDYNTDTYLYVCNGAQHSSSYDLNHRYWVREKSPTALTASPWDGTKGGIVAFRANGTVTVNNGAISTAGIGYRGGSGSGALWSTVRAYKGESFAGPSVRSSAATSLNMISADGGGSGGALASGGPGGSYGFLGTNGLANNVGHETYKGLVGITYGQANLSDRMLFGSGGGGGGDGYNNSVWGQTNTYNGVGGNGGGITFIGANTLTVNSTGKIDSNGDSGTQGWSQNSATWITGGSGGGGAGGSVALFGNTLTLGNKGVTASGGKSVSPYAGNYANGYIVSPVGGNGGAGRIAALYSTAISGVSEPGASMTKPQVKNMIEGTGALQLTTDSIQSDGTVGLWHFGQNSSTKTFGYTGADQTYVVPAGVTSLTVKMWGGGGGGGAPGGWTYGYPGGGSGYTTGTLAVTPGQVLTVMVGAGGNKGSSSVKTSSYGGGGQNCATAGTDCQYAGQGGGRSAIIKPIVSNATGGTVSTVNGNRIHTFIADGTFTPDFTGTIEVLVVAGGGSGGGAGGGGGGGVIYTTTYAVTAGVPIPITVGPGGPTKAGNGVGNNGSKSVFGSLTAIGGGGGGTYNGVTVGSGGSGGGGGSCNTTVAGSGTENQGHSGGTGWTACSPYTSGGGGGAGADGTAATVTNSGNGGFGIQNNIDGNNYYYGGGGGGGSQGATRVSGNGGIGGGGGGATLNGSTAGTGGGAARNTGGNGQLRTTYPPCDGGAGGVNTGGGGGGMGISVSNGGAGGSGIVIVRISEELLTAGGGGGGGSKQTVVSDMSGGGGGGTNGEAGLAVGAVGTAGGGGTQSAGGAGATITVPYTGSNGTHYYGGSPNSNSYGGGGGGGWYGGGGGGYAPNYMGGGGGGSGYIGGTGVSSATTTAANARLQANMSDADNGGAGAGGIADTSGSPGKVVIIPNVSNTDLPYQEADTSGSGNHGTLNGTTLVDGLFGKARSFNGTSDYISIPSNNNFDFKSNDFSISFWWKENGSTNASAILSYGSTGSGYESLLIYITGSVLSLYSSSTGSSWDIASAIPMGTTDVGVFNNYVVTRNGNTFTTYKNGIVAGTATSSLSLINGSTFYMGRRVNSATFIKGTLDEVKISNTVLSADQIAEAYRLGRDKRVSKTITSTNLTNKTKLPFWFAGDRAGTYGEMIVGSSAFANYEPDANTVGLWHLEEASGNGAYLKDSAGGNHGTPTGTTVTQGKIGKARSFASGNGIIVPSNANLNLANNFTIEAWVKISTSGVQHMFASKYQASTGWAFFRHSDNKFYMQGGNGSTWPGAFNCSTSTTYTDSNWHHVAAVVGSSVSIYIDGVAVVSGCTRSADVASNTEIFLIGGYTGIGLYVGTIDEVRYSNIARSAPQIREAYEVGRRSHPITVEFKARIINSGLLGDNLLANANDLWFSIDETAYGSTAKANHLFPGDKLIVKENYAGTEYIAQGTVDTVVSSTGNIAMLSWDSGSTFPTGGQTGFSVNATVFKWQKEYMDIAGLSSTDKDAVTQLTMRITDSSQGANIWLDDFRGISSYLSNQTPTSFNFATGVGTYRMQAADISSTLNRYIQYRAINSSWDTRVAPALTSVAVNYISNTPPSDLSITFPENNTTGHALKPIIQLSAKDDNNDNLQYKIQLATDTGFTANLQTFDQTDSQLNQAGWSASTYESGAIAIYTYTAQDTALTGNTIYYIRAYAKDPGGSTFWSSESTTVKFTTNARPGAPTISAPSNGATGQVLKPVIQLKAVDPEGDVLKYKIQLATDTGFTANLQTFDQTDSQLNQAGWSASSYASDTTATYTIQTALTADTIYYIRASAIDLEGSLVSSSVSSTTHFTTGTFTAPANCQAIASTSIGPSIVTWTDSSVLEEKYYIETSIAGIAEGAFTPTATLNSNTTSFSQVIPSEGGAYTYRIRASSLGQYTDYCTTQAVFYYPQGKIQLEGVGLEGLQIY